MCYVMENNKLEFKKKKNQISNSEFQNVNAYYTLFFSLISKISSAQGRLPFVS